MLFEKEVLKKQIVSLLFPIVCMVIVMLLLLKEPDWFSFLVFFPICFFLIGFCIWHLIGCTYALKHTGFYLVLGDEELQYFNHFGRVVYRIQKKDITGIVKQEGFLKIYVKERRKLSHINRLRSILLEEQWNMYPLMLYGEFAQSEVYGHTITDMPKEHVVKEYRGLSRYLFTFLFACSTWYMISDIFAELWPYLVLLAVTVCILCLDYWLNPHNICEANWRQAGIKSVSIGAFLAAYWSVASFHSKEIAFDDRGWYMLAQKNGWVYLLVVVGAFCLLIFPKNILTVIHRKRK